MRIAESRLRRIIREELLRESGGNDFEVQYPIRDVAASGNISATWYWTSANPRYTLARALAAFSENSSRYSSLYHNVLGKIDRSVQNAMYAQGPDLLPAEFEGESDLLKERIIDLERYRRMVEKAEEFIGSGKFVEFAVANLPESRVKQLESSIKKSKREEDESLTSLREALGLQKTAWELRQEREAAGQTRAGSSGRATPAQVEEGIRELIRRNTPPSEAVRDTIRGLINNPSGDVKSYVLSLIEAPVDDGNDPYAYRGIKVPADSLRSFGVDPTGLPGGTWIDLMPDETERNTYDDDEEEEGTPAAHLPTPREVPLPTPPEMTTSSWTYNPAIAKRFAGEPSGGDVAIVLAAHVQDNFPRFLELFRLYRVVDAEAYSGETELLGVASNRDPIRGIVRFIRLP
jgi:hypothetical protein